jgi:exopolyphosphatase
MAASSHDASAIPPAPDVDALNAFLRASRAALADPNASVALVMGNEAADLDSMACAVSLAYAAANGSGRGVGSVSFVAMIAVPREDFALRTDAAWLFRDVGVDISALVFSDEVDPLALRDAGRLKSVTLVDHNRAAAAYESVVHLVDVVVDHHEDEGKYPSTASTTIAPVGSCATLVTEAMDGSFRRSGALNGEGPLARLLAGAVALDTQNLDFVASRATERDAAALARLAPLAGLPAAADVSSFYETLKRRRFDQAGLSPRDLLRRDYKQWDMGGWIVGIASFGVPLAKMGDPDDVAAACDAFAEERGLDILALMSGFDDDARGGAFARQLAMRAAPGAPEGTGRVLREMAEEAMRDALGGLTAFEGAGAFEDGVAFRQGDPKGSRKKVQPVMLAYLEARPKATLGGGK